MADLYAKYNCTYCQEDITGLRVRCVECPDFNLCLQCFSAGAEIGPHKNDHYYQFKDSGTISIFNGRGNWTAREQLRLLDAIEQFGFGNWEDISKHIETRTPEEAKEEYIARYLDGNIGKHTWPPTESYKPNLTDQTKSDHGPLSPDLTSRLPPLDITPEEAAQLGYMPQRDDFERDYNHEAESLVSSLFLNPAEDDDLDIALKLAQVDMYTNNLKEMPATIQEKTKQHRVVNVKESIRNIINQFREFEKDFGHEDLDVKKETVVAVQLKGADTNLSQESINVSDTTKEEDNKTVKDAKESLRDIINQFKQIKSELFSDDDSEFEEIEATFMDRSISETLMKFSESLKNLIHRRKQEKQFVAENLDVKKDVSRSESMPKVAVKDTQVLTETAKNLKMQNVEKLGTVIRNTDAKDSSSTETDKLFQEKSFTMYTNNGNVPLNAQRFVDNVSNDIGKTYASKEEDEKVKQQNVENNTNN